MIGNLLDLKPNKVSVDLTQYSTVWMGDTGVGKTTTFMKFLKELVPDKDPLFLEFEDRFQNIPGITVSNPFILPHFTGIEKTARRFSAGSFPPISILKITL